ncbi:MAG: hypothetical protein ACOY9Y_01540 [Bacillota bacterium]
MGKIYAFYSPSRGAGLTTLLINVAEWLAADTELTVALFDFSSRTDLSCNFSGKQVSLAGFLASGEVEYEREKPVAVCDLKPDNRESFRALEKAAGIFDLVFVDMSNRLDQIGYQVLEMSHRIILLAPGTELVVRYFHNMLELGRVLEKQAMTGKLELVVNRVRHEEEIAVLTKEIKTKMMGFTRERPGPEDYKRLAENFYYDFYLQKLADERLAHFRKAVDKFNQQIQTGDPQEVALHLWNAVHHLTLPFTKRMLLFRWLVFRARLGQSFSEAAEELIPRFITEEFEALAKELAMETQSLGGMALTVEADAKGQPGTKTG